MRHYWFMSIDSPHNSQSKLSVAEAANRLQDALRALEGALTPMADRLGKLEKASADSEAFTQDRARLARQLDESKARQQELEDGNQRLLARENEFKALADETMQELDAVISQVRHALSDGGSA